MLPTSPKASSAPSLRTSTRAKASRTSPRKARDDAATNLRATLIDIRAAIDATYGEKGLTLLGLNAAIPVDPSALAVTATAVSQALHDASLKLPKRAGMKNQAMEQNDATFSSVADWISTGAVLAGLDTVAAKVRPSSRSSGRTAVEEETGNSEKTA